MHESNVRKRKRQTEEDNASQNSGNESSQRRLQESPANNSFMASIALTTVLFALLCVYGYYSSPINAVEITGVVEVPFEGSFALNRKLSKGKRIPIHAPESCVETSDKKIYLSLHDGRIVCIHPSSDGEIGAGKVENITTGIIQGAVTTSDAWGHGRPLGLRLRQNTLYVMDAIYGFYVVDLPTKSIKILVKPDDVSPPMKFPDDFDITADGKTVYFTDASAKYPIPLLVQEVLEGTCTGRILKYDMVSQKLEVVRDGLCFPNGLQLTDDESIVIVPETTRYRVNWIDIKTWDTVHVLNLPAMPDNLRRNSRGNYWVAASSKHSPMVAFLGKFPSLRQIIIGLIPQSVILRMVDSNHCMLFEVNSSGELIQTLHDPNGDLAYALSQGTELSDGRIALGSYKAQFLAITDEKL